MPAYESPVRPTLEYACIVWHPHIKNDIASMKKILSWPFALFSTGMAVIIPFSNAKRSPNSSPVSSATTNRLKFLYDLYFQRLKIDPVRHVWRLERRSSHAHLPFPFHHYDAISFCCICDPTFIAARSN